MPSRRLPNSTPAVLRTLRTATDTYNNTPNKPDRALSDATWAKLDETDPNSLHSRFRKEANEVDLAQAAQAPLVSALAQTAALLTTYVSHFHQVLDLGIERGIFVPGDRHFYDRENNDTAIPRLVSYDEIQAVAEAIVKGEADRISSTSPSAATKMALPSAAEVGGILATFKTERAAVQTAEVKTDTEREDVTAQYADAQELAVDVCDETEYFYRKDPSAPSRRAKCRRWGVVYVYAPQETPDPADPNPIVLDGGAGGAGGAGENPGGGAPG